MSSNPISITEATDRALEQAYIQTAGPMLEQIARLATAGEMQIALQELEAEALRLIDEERRMETENPTLITSILAYGALLAAVQALIVANSGDVEVSGQQLAAPSITAKVFSTLSQIASPVSPAALGEYTARLALLGIDWRLPDVNTLARAYTGTQVWRDRMEGWGAGYADLTRNTILQGIQNGWGPRQVANTMRQHATSIPLHAAENITRTLQLTAYRDAVLALEIENSRFITGKIRVAVLDGSTCAACVALHGTPLAVGERVEDHYRGRCSEAYLLPTRTGPPEFMMADGQLTRWQTGEDWFAGLSPQRQAAQDAMRRTPALLNAYNSGIPLSEFVGRHEDSVFGGQIVQQSLLQALGAERASEFYVR